MSWTVNDAEYKSVTALPPPKRYEYFVKRAASHGELWGLRDKDGWVTSADDEGERYFPVWPHARYAEACAAGAWDGASPEPIDIDEWVVGWLPNLDRDGLAVAVFQTADDEAEAVGVERLRRDLEAELAKFGDEG